MSVKSEITKTLLSSASRVSKHLVKEMIQLPNLNMRYNLVNRIDTTLLNTAHKALSAPANIISEGKNIMYEARKNKSNEDINYNNTTQYNNMNQMLQDSYLYSHTNLYKHSNINDLNLAETYSNMELASNARRNIRNNFKR
ncbi:hypothetical protein GSQ54_20060 [Clostridioides difficile]|nr:hypothetical protein [Clostridioides difficile]